MGHEVMILKVPGMTKVSCAEEMRDYVLECAFNPYNIAAQGEGEDDG